jgi:hypothetical protein
MSLQPLWRPFLVTIGAAGFLSAALAVAFAADVSLPSLTMDPNTTLGVPWYVGSISLLSVLIWSSTSAVALAASFRAGGQARGFLTAFGVFGLVLAIDDGFMVHEEVVTTLFGRMAQPVLIGVYGFVAMLIAYRWWRVLTPTALVFAAFSVGMLGASVVADLLYLLPVVAEDALKFVGIVAWGGVAVAQAAHAVPHSRERSVDEVVV